MKDDDLTLEKLEISKRLREAELQLARIVSHLDSEEGTFQRVLAPILEQTKVVRDMTVSHAKILHGNGEKGMILQVNNLENITKLITWIMGTLTLSTIGIIVTAMWKLILK